MMTTLLQMAEGIGDAIADEDRRTAAVIYTGRRFGLSKDALGGVLDERQRKRDRLVEAHQLLTRLAAREPLVRAIAAGERQ